MGVLESPITWIVVAAVLVVLAILLLALSAVRRRRARRAAAAAAWPPPALEASRPNPDAPWTGPAPVQEPVRVTTRRAVSNVSGRPGAAAATRYAEPDTAPLDVETIRARLAAELGDDGAEHADGSDEPAAPPAQAHPARGDDSPEAPAGTPTAAPAVGAEPHRPRHAAPVTGGPDDTDDTDGTNDTKDTASTAGTTGAEDTDGTKDTAAAPASAESAKDRLLGVLLRDPSAAVAALDAAGRDDAAGRGDVTALLRAGLSPAQVARLVGVDERVLATSVARRLGLLPGGAQVPGGVGATGENRTVDPGRSCANAASSAGSTTPTTG